MTNKVLHLSIALLTLAPSLHAAAGKGPKRTFADAVKAINDGNKGIAGILGLSEDAEKEKAEKVAGPATALEKLTPPSSPNVVTVQPTAQPQQSLEQVVRAANASSAAAAAALAALTSPTETSAESAPARLKGLEAAAQAVQDPKNTFVHWETLQQELAHIDAELKALQDPNAAQVEGTQRQTELEQRRKEVTREIRRTERIIKLKEFKKAALASLATNCTLLHPIPTRQSDGLSLETSLEEASKRREEQIANRIVRAQNATRRSEQQRRKANLKTLGVKTPSGMKPQDGLHVLRRLETIARLTEAPFHAEQSDWQNALYEFTRKNQENTLEILTQVTDCNKDQLPNALSFLEENPKNVAGLLSLHNLPNAPEGDAKRTEYQKFLNNLRNETRHFPEFLQSTRKNLKDRIKEEQTHHGMPAGTWGDTLTAWNPFGSK